MNPQALLEKLGYTPHEVKIYLAALELGDATVTELAHKAEFPRTTVQEVIEHMQKKGLLKPFIKKQHKYWVAENPERLLANLKANEESFTDLLPELMSLRRNPSNKPQMVLYTGLSEIKNIMDDIIESKHHVSTLISLDDWYNFFGSEYTQDFIKRRHTHFLKMRMITPKSEKAIELKKNDDRELRHIRFLPEGIDLRRITNFIYGDKFAIISFNKKEPTGIIINDPDLTHGNRLYFENLWLHSNEN